MEDYVEKRCVIKIMEAMMSFKGSGCLITITSGCFALANACDYPGTRSYYIHTRNITHTIELTHQRE